MLQFGRKLNSQKRVIFEMGPRAKRVIKLDDIGLNLSGKWVITPQSKMG